jgi:hypothetical protein
MHCFLRKQQAICCLFITFYRQTDNYLKTPPSFATHILILPNCQNCQQLGPAALDLCTNFMPNITFQLLYCVWVTPVYAFFQVSHWKKSGTVRSGDPTGHGIPDRWKRSSSLVNKLHTRPIHCHWTEQVFKMADIICFSTSRSCTVLPSQGKSAFWNVSPCTLARLKETSVYMTSKNLS